MKRKDIKYWGEMTWDWYAVPFVVDSSKYKKRARIHSVNTDLRYCEKCENVYSVDSNKGGKTYYPQYNYSMIPNIKLKPKECFICLGRKAKLERM